MSRWVMDGPTLHAISRALVYEAEPIGSIKETLKSIDERTSSKCRRQSGARGLNHYERGAPVATAPELLFHQLQFSCIRGNHGL